MKQNQDLRSKAQAALENSSICKSRTLKIFGSPKSSMKQQYATVTNLSTLLSQDRKSTDLRVFTPKPAALAEEIAGAKQIKISSAFTESHSNLKRLSYQNYKQRMSTASEQQKQDQFSAQKTKSIGQFSLTERQGDQKTSTKIERKKTPGASQSNLSKMSIQRPDESTCKRSNSGTSVDDLCNQESMNEDTNQSVSDMRSITPQLILRQDRQSQNSILDCTKDSIYGVSILEAKLTFVEDENISFRQQIRQLEQRLQKLIKSSASEKEELLKKLDHQVKSSEMNTVKLQQQIQQQTALIAKHVDTIKNLENQISIIEKDNDQIIDELASKRKELSTVLTENQHLQQENQKFQNSQDEILRKLEQQNNKQVLQRPKSALQKQTVLLDLNEQSMNQQTQLDNRKSSLKTILKQDSQQQNEVFPDALLNSAKSNKQVKFIIDDQILKTSDSVVGSFIEDQNKMFSAVESQLLEERKSVKELEQIDALYIEIQNLMSELSQQDQQGCPPVNLQHQMEVIRLKKLELGKLIEIYEKQQQ